MRYTPSQGHHMPCILTDTYNLIDACPFRHFTFTRSMYQLAEQVALKSLVAEIFAKLQVAENMVQVADVESTELSDTAHPVVQEPQVRTRGRVGRNLSRVHSVRISYCFHSD